MQRDLHLFRDISFFIEAGINVVLFDCSMFMEFRTKIQGMTIETQLKRRRIRRQLDKTSKRPRPICAVRFPFSTTSAFPRNFSQACRLIKRCVT